MKSGKPARPKPPIGTGRAAPLPERASGPAIIASLLDAAQRQAEERSLDRIVSVVEPETYGLLRSRLDVPAEPNARLHRTLNTPAPWDPA